MNVVLTIDGDEIDLGAQRIQLGELSLRVDGYDQLEFSQVGSTMELELPLYVDVTLEVDYELVFSGLLVSGHPSHGGANSGWTVGYRAVGLAYLADRIPLLNGATSNNRYAFNARASDEEFNASLSGLTFGQAVAAVLGDHGAALNAVGIGVDQFDAGNVVGELADALELIDHTPYEKFSLTGDYLWNSLTSFMRQFAPNHALRIDPDGWIRVIDFSDPGDAITITIGESGVAIPDLDIDLTESASRVEVRGSAKVEGAVLSYLDGNLLAMWSVDDQEAWTMTEFESPAGLKSWGAVTTSDSTTVTVDPDEADHFWAENFWGPAQARGDILLEKTSIPGVTRYEVRAVASNTELEAGGTSEITVDYELTNDEYSRFTIVGRNAGLAHVWRKFEPDEPAKSYLARKFPREIAWRTTNGVKMVEYAVGTIVWTESDVRREAFAAVEIDAANGEIWFYRPVVEPINGRDALMVAEGYTIPDDIQVFVPLRVGTITTQYPAAGAHAGTAYTVHGLERTAYLNFDEWDNPAATARMTRLAEEVHRSLKDRIINMNLSSLGWDDRFFYIGQAITVQAKRAPGGPAVDTGIVETLTVRSVSYDFSPSSVDGVTVAALSNAYIARPDGLYTHGIRWRPDATTDTQAFAPDATSLALGVVASNTVTAASQEAARAEEFASQASMSADRAEQAADQANPLRAQPALAAMPTPPMTGMPTSAAQIQAQRDAVRRNWLNRPTLKRQSLATQANQLRSQYQQARQAARIAPREAASQSPVVQAVRAQQAARRAPRPSRQPRPPGGLQANQPPINRMATNPRYQGLRPTQAAQPRPTAPPTMQAAQATTPPAMQSRDITAPPPPPPRPAVPRKRQYENLRKRYGKM